MKTHYRAKILLLCFGAATILSITNSRLIGDGCDLTGLDQHPPIDGDRR